MDALTLLREQAAMADGLLTQVFASVTAEQAVWLPPESTVNAIATLFLHLYSSEDRSVQRLQGGRPPLYAIGDWQERLAYDPANAWTTPREPDLSAYRAYAGTVRAATVAFLDTLSPDRLSEEVETPRGKRALGLTLSLMLVLHKMAHTGEISALLGAQGLKGFPI